MAKRVFFSFHYKDVVEFRANVVRKHWVVKGAAFFRIVVASTILQAAI